MASVAPQDRFTSALPGSYQENPNIDIPPIQQYLEEVFSILDQNKNLYDFQLTKIFQSGAIQNIPQQWAEALKDLEHEELNNIPYGFYKDSWPSSLIEFIKKCLDLSQNRAQNQKVDSTCLSKEDTKGMNPKKIHEVGSLAALIDHICKENQCQQIIDVGSGLGYLSLILCQKYNYKVIGLENKESRSHGAQQRAFKCDVAPENFKALTFELDDSEESFTAFEHLIEQAFPRANTVTDRPATNHTTHDTTSTTSNTRICMLGLHCCGDLTPTMLKLFKSVSDIKCLVCISCCYHRMQAKPGGFRNFPLSCMIKDYVKKCDITWTMTQFALRLAAQETRTRWREQSCEDHASHTRNVGYRGVLEVVLDERGGADRGRRRLVHKGDKSNLDDYVNAVARCLKLEGDDENEFRDEMASAYQQHKKDFDLIEPLTCLQVLLQPVLETLITIDRVWFLMENSLVQEAKEEEGNCDSINCGESVNEGPNIKIDVDVCMQNTIVAKAIPVFDENISPRNLAMVASKEGYS